MIFFSIFLRNKIPRRCHRLGKAKLKSVPEVGDSKASFEGEYLAVKHRKIERKKKKSVRLF